MSALHRRSTLAHVNAEQPKPGSASRFKALRVARGYDTLKKLSGALGGAIKESALRNYEASRGVPRDDVTRKVIADFFGLSRDDLANYLDGEMSLEQALAASSKAGSLPPPSTERVVAGPLLRTHPEWADLCARAIATAPDLTPDTLKEIGLKPFLYGPLDSVEVQDVIDLGRIHQRLHRRS